ncbi:hypothetical protein Pyn_29033 [Prunus yedoensis var. nudiflora]|uniref:Uncharacterized protein n=1 Tax=Prunus yedoensis var. nudiflora TaxID=2094558 RepID=A0A314UND6_PRUYE|nr:hypothetical protein Pyn_29033 [Prunus yedoensis var. nudiflora]
MLHPCTAGTTNMIYRELTKFRVSKKMGAEQHMIMLLRCISPLFTDCKRNAYMEAELQCSNAIQSMERKPRIACHVLKTAKSKVDSYDAEISSMKLEMKDLSEKLEAANA